MKQSVVRVFLTLFTLTATTLIPHVHADWLSFPHFYTVTDFNAQDAAGTPPKVYNSQISVTDANQLYTFGGTIGGILGGILDL